MEEKKSTNWGLIIGIVLAVLAAAAAGAYFVMKYLKKKECECGCCDGEIDDCDICVLDDEDEAEIETEPAEEAE